MKFKLINNNLSLAEPIKETIKENAIEVTKEFAIGVLIALRDILVELIGAIALIGGGTLILFRVVGFDDGYKYAGILFLANILIKYILGV